MARTRNLGNLTDLLTAGSTYVTAATPPQFDNSQNLVTSAFVQRALGNFNSSSTSISSTSITLTAANCGSHLYFNGVANQTVTLPSEIGLPVGSAIIFQRATANFTVTINSNSGNSIIDSTQGLFPSITLTPGDFVGLVWNGTYWDAWGTYNQRLASTVNGLALTGQGYQKLPSGLILQWGQATTNGSGVATLTLPIAFPSAFLIGTANYLQNALGVQSVTATISTNCTTTSLVATASSGNTAVASAVIYFIGIGK